MPRYIGPCVVCGKPLDGYVKNGRIPRCFECGLEAQAEHNRAMADGTAPTLARSVEAGRAVADELRKRKGPSYEKWRDAMVAAALDPYGTT